MVDDDIKKTGNYLFAKLDSTRKKISELENSLESAKDEVGYLEIIINKLNLCRACFAKGSFYRYTALEDKHKEACPSCEGEGRIIPELKREVCSGY